MLTCPATQNETFAAIRAMGLTVRKTGYGNEIRVAYADLKGDEQEASAYYTDDREDAFYTAVRMVEDSH